MVEFDKISSEKEEAISKYNVGTLKNLRLEGLWDNFRRYLQAGKLEACKWALDNIWGELSGDEMKIDKDYNITRSLAFGKIREFNKKIAESSGRSELFQLLQEKQTYLSALQNKQGKGTAYKDESEDDMD